MGKVIHRYLYQRIGISLFVVIILTGIIGLSLPASWWLQALKQHVPRLNAHQVSGYIWSGKVLDAEIIYRGYAIPLGDVTWRVDWSSLWRFKPCIIFSSHLNSQSSNGYLCTPFFSQQATFPLFAFAISGDEVANALGIEIRGHFQVNMNSLSVTNDHISDGSGHITWEDAQFYNGEEWLTLGNIFIAISSDKHTGDMTVHWRELANHDGQSPIKLDIDMLFSYGRLASVSGTLTPHYTHEKSMTDTLQLISHRQKGNTFFIEKDWQ